MQWIIGVIFPVSREINLWVLEKIWRGMSNSDYNLEQIFNLTATIKVNLAHAVYVAIVISTKTTQFTTLCVLAVDVLFNIYGCYKIIRKRQIIHSTNTNEKIRNSWKVDVLKLCGVEVVEFLTPIAYAITFAIAFYGTNAEIIGGVKFSDWQYQEVVDIGSYLYESGMMFIADFLCTMVTGILLWKFNLINMLEEIYKLVSIFWPFISINMAGTMFTVIIFILYAEHKGQLVLDVVISPSVLYPLVSVISK